VASFQILLGAFSHALQPSTAMPHAHRSGSLKQTNKKHKGLAASKRAAKAGQGAGRVEGSEISRPLRAAGSKSTHDKDAARTGRLDRANQTKQRREQKRGAIWLQKRVGGGACAPKIALWIALSPLADCAAVQSLLLEEAAGEACITHTGAGAQAVCMTTVLFAQYKQRVTFVQPARRDVMAMLELAKVADIVILVLPVQQGIEQAVDQVSTVMFANFGQYGTRKVRVASKKFVRSSLHYTNCRCSCSSLATTCMFRNH
jgi:hypothetical protein